ncbi:peptidoglycan-binding protein LysM [Streptomyces massasporeus]|uniref:peptidoglycan-binding protein LysM n=1 Tax=Streptomyces massasporeus TaxID=67324 RepID=UPI00379344D9
MALLSFIKDAGERLFDSQGADGWADRLKRHIDATGLDTASVSVKVSGDTVLVSGTTSDPEAAVKVIVALGNVQGVAAVDFESLQPGIEEFRFHDAVSGDNLWKIAEKYFGDGTQNTAIFDANKPMLSTPDRIYPGQKLVIPSLA